MLVSIFPFLDHFSVELLSEDKKAAYNMELDEGEEVYEELELAAGQDLHEDSVEIAEDQWVSLNLLILMPAQSHMCELHHA